MPDFLVSAATGALSPVLHKLAAMLGNEYKRFKGVRGEVKFLIQELEAMHAFLLKKSEEENPDAQDKVWMKEVRELSYDIEDSLDDFRVRVNDESAKPDGFIDKCKNLLDKTKARRRIAKEVEKLKGQVKEVSERNARYKICNTAMNTSKVIVDPRALAIFEDASRLVGIDQPKQEIISFLKTEDGDISSQQPKIVSIVGIGGIGKTTLANRVYEDLKGQFECRVFFSLSRNPDIIGILKTILIKVTGQDCYMADIQQLIIEIKDFLRTRRYLVVVDDVWDVKTWEIIKCALPNNSCGSVIITTTRIHDVATACCSLYPGGWVYQPKPLGEHDSKRLFQNRIFGPKNECPEYLKEVVDKILKKCGGLPLAIITISSLLANKARKGVHSVTEWVQVHTSIGHGLERDSTVEGMMGILSLSYFDLPSHLKACLLYLSAFPEDYEIEKDRLVRLWVAEGFIPVESTCTLYESGEKSFTELINRNLILPMEISNWNGEVNSCRLHDTILDFIVSKSTEDNFLTVHGIPRLTPPQGMKVRRLSMQDITNGDVGIHFNQNYANVRSIFCFGFPCSLLGFRFLRVLDFTSGLIQTHGLANIGDLLHLRYLSLKDTIITALPEQIGVLQYLETLDLRGCSISQLPTAIVRLKSLVNLLGPCKLYCFPSGIKNMQALEELNSIEGNIHKAAIFLEEIGDLTKMRHLDISFIAYSGMVDNEIYVVILKKMVSSFQKLNKLQSLHVRFDCWRDAGHDFIFDDVIPEEPWCSASLRRLRFMMNPMSRVPRWMKSLVNLEELLLRITKLDEESLCILGDLPVLVTLTLEIVVNNLEEIFLKKTNLEDIPSTHKQRLLISNWYGYRSLRCLNVFSDPAGFRFRHPILNPSFPMLTFEAGSMPMLEKLCIAFHADITISVTNGRLDFGLKHLSQLTEIGCFMFGHELNILRVEAAIQKELDNHPKLPYFEKERLPSTTELALPTDLSFTIHHLSASPDLGRRHGQRCRRSKARQGTAIRGREFVQGALHIPDRAKGTSGATPSAPSDVLGPLLIAAPQQQEAFVPPCFTFSSGSPPNNEAERQAMACYELSQHDYLANVFTSTFNGLSLRDDHPPGSSATTVEVSSIYSPCRGTAAAPAPSDVLGPLLIAAPQQQGAFVQPCFTFSSKSPPTLNLNNRQQWTFTSRPNITMQQMPSATPLTHPGPSATAVESTSSDTGTQTNEPIRRILVPRRRRSSSGGTAK